jgi:hypothetical protein
MVGKGAHATATGLERGVVFSCTDETSFIGTCCQPVASGSSTSDTERGRPFTSALDGSGGRLTVFRRA